MKIYKYLAIALAGIAVGAASCTDHVEYTPASGVNSDEVYFPNTDPSQVVVKPGQTQGTIDVYRQKTDDELTVDIATVCTLDGEPSTVFTFPSSITFAPGQSVTTIDFAIDAATIVPEVDYTLDVALEGDVDTPYGLSERTFTIYLDPWKTPVLYSTTEPATVTLGTPFGVSYQTALYVAESETNPNQLKYSVFTSDAVNSYFDIDAGFEVSFIVDKSKPYEVDGETCYLMSVPTVHTGFIYDEAPVILQNAIDWFRDLYNSIGKYPTDEQLLTAMSQYGKTYSYFIPSKGLAVISYLPYDEGAEAGYGYLSASSYYVQLPGYHNYYFEYDILGNYVDATGAEYLEIQVYKSDDIANYAVSLELGALTEAQVQAAAEAIISNPNVTIYSEESTILRLPVSEEGDYTIVAVGFDEGINPVYTGSYTFEFTSVQKETMWEAFSEADYTDGIMCSIFTAAEPMTWPVQVEQHKETPGLYRLVNAYRDYPYNEPADLVNGNHYIIIDATDPDAVVFEESSLGTDWGHGNITAINQAQVIIDAGNATKEQLIQYGYYGTLEDGVITFPAGTILAAMANYKGGAWAFWCNLDPKNPGLADDYEGELDPYWGEGPMRIEIYNLMPDEVNARSAKAARTAVSKSARTLRNANASVIASKSNGIKAVNPKEYKISARRVSL